jgi:hypothetical protein
MPRKEIDYSNTIIYKIECNDLNITDCYVGHTTEFRKRKSQHKSDCNNIKRKQYNYNVYKFIRDNGGWENWTMVMIQHYPCNNALEAGRRERHWFKRLNATLNTQVPSRSKKESNKNYNENHKEKIHINKNQKHICCCGGKYTSSHKAKHIHTIKHQQYTNNKIEQQFQHCVELFKSTKHLNIH